MDLIKEDNEERELKIDNQDESDAEFYSMNEISPNKNKTRNNGESDAKFFNQLQSQQRQEIRRSFSPPFKAIREKNISGE